MNELRKRGHDIVVRTLPADAEQLRTMGFEASSIAPPIIKRTIDDWKANSPPAALIAATKTFVDRSRHETTDLRTAIEVEQPDALYIDVNAWGASAMAEASGLPWAVFAPYFMPIQDKGIPPWGLGLEPRRGLFASIRDALGWRLMSHLFDLGLNGVNETREGVGVRPFQHATEFATNPPILVSYTAEPFEYPRNWPENFRMVGPGIWEPPSENGLMLPPGDEPLILATCSTEFQNDGDIISSTLSALAGDKVRVIATSGSIDPDTFDIPANARVERYAPHGEILKQASCVVCHGGMGITQKALASGVPLCVIPFGRDQLEVARHVEVCEAGTRLPPKKLDPKTLRDAIHRAMKKTVGAERVQEAFREAGGAEAAADAVEEILDGSTRHSRATGEPSRRPASA
jgi:MGT family glycosyltransferase